MYAFEMTIMPNQAQILTWEIGQLPCKDNTFINFLAEETCRLFPEAVCRFFMFS